MPAEHLVDHGSKPRPIWVLDNMRSRSHLFMRIFSQHESLSQVSHPYLLAARLGPERIQLHLNRSKNKTDESGSDNSLPIMPTTFANANEELNNRLNEIANNSKIPMIEEHCAFVLKHSVILHHLRDKDGKGTQEAAGPYQTLDFNPTSLPDSLFQSIKPILLIRHPAQQIPSYYRLAKSERFNSLEEEDFEYCISYRWARLLFDKFQAQGREGETIIVDSDDLIWYTKRVTSAICNAIGIDSKGMIEQWEATPLEKRPQHPAAAAATKEIHNSTGIERPIEKPVCLNLDDEMLKWISEFGREIAMQLMGHVEKQLPDYHYLMQFKI